MTVQPIRSNADHNPHPGPDRTTEDEMLTLQEACAFLRVPEGTLRYWRHLDCGPRSFKIGRHVRYWRPISSSGSPSRPTVHSTADSLEH